MDDGELAGGVSEPKIDNLGNGIKNSDQDDSASGSDSDEAGPENAPQPGKQIVKKVPFNVPTKLLLPMQSDPVTLDLSSLSPLTPEIIARQATINIGTIGHVAHGKSTVVKALSGVQTVRFKSEQVRNITIKLGYANAKVYKCDSLDCPRPGNYTSFGSDKEVSPACERDGCTGTYRLLRHVS